MTTPETYPAYGQVWKNRRTQREVFIKQVGKVGIWFRYFDTKRSCAWVLDKFRKQFTFSHVFV